MPSDSLLPPIPSLSNSVEEEIGIGELIGMSIGPLIIAGYFLLFVGFYLFITGWALSLGIREVNSSFMAIGIALVAATQSGMNLWGYSTTSAQSSSSPSSSSSFSSESLLLMLWNRIPSMTRMIMLSIGYVMISTMRITRYPRRWLGRAEKGGLLIPYLILFAIIGFPFLSVSSPPLLEGVPDLLASRVSDIRLTIGFTVWLVLQYLIARYLRLPSNLLRALRYQYGRDRIRGSPPRYRKEAITISCHNHLIPPLIKLVQEYIGKEHFPHTFDIQKIPFSPTVLKDTISLLLYQMWIDENSCRSVQESLHLPAIKFGKKFQNMVVNLPVRFRFDSGFATSFQARNDPPTFILDTSRGKQVIHAWKALTMITRMPFNKRSSSSSTSSSSTTTSRSSSSSSSSLLSIPMNPDSISGHFLSPSLAYLDDTPSVGSVGDDIVLPIHCPPGSFDNDRYERWPMNGLTLCVRLKFNRGWNGYGAFAIHLWYVGLRRA